MRLAKYKFTSDKKQESPLSLKNLKLRLWLLMTLGVCLLLAGVIYSISSEKSPWIEIADSIRDFGFTIIASATIALLLKVPSLFQDVNDSAIKLLTNNNYLKRLDVNELRKLRADATESAYMRNVKSVNETLKELDLKISELFLQPYFETYQIKISCKLLQDNNDYIEKKISTEFVLINPRKEKCNGIEFIKFRVVQNKINVENERSLVSLDVLIDNEREFTSIKEKFKVRFTQFYEESTSYDRLSIITLKEESNKDAEMLAFKHQLKVRLVERRIIPKSDTSYLYRVINPIKFFMINYSFEDCPVNLIGNGFATFQTTKNGGISIVKDPNSIHISCKKWLLPGNGIIIVHNYLK